VVRDLGAESAGRNRSFSDSYVRYALSYLVRGE